MTRLSNRLAEERRRLGWTQARMADAAGISRQSYSAIESGASVPSTEIALRLADACGREVSQLFRLPEVARPERRAVWSAGSSASVGRRVRLARVAGRSVAHPMNEAHDPSSPAHGVVTSTEPDGVAVAQFEHAPPVSDLVVVGCDPSFGIVREVLRRDHGIEATWQQRGSRGALEALARGEAHVAGVHLLDEGTGAWNATWVERLVPFPCTRVFFAVWEQGLLFRPVQVGGLTPVGLGGGGVRLLNREVGSGSRALLDAALLDAGIDPSSVDGYDTAARGHLSVAAGIASGAADAGVAIRAAGEAYGLSIFPLREEAYELVIPDHFLDLPAIDALLTTLGRRSVRAQVESLGGYDASRMGSPAT